MTFLVVPVENFREERNIWKGSPVFFRTEYSKQKFVFHLLKAIVDTSFRSSRSFFGECNWFVQMVYAIPGRHLPVLNFASPLPKPWTNRFAPVNGKQPGSSLTPFLNTPYHSQPYPPPPPHAKKMFPRIPIWSGTQEDLFINLLVMCSWVLLGKQFNLH